MKRRQFRLGSVLRHYELQKQKTDLELQQAMQTLARTDTEIAALEAGISQVSAIVHGAAAATLSADGWLACYRKAAHLEILLKAAQERRRREADVVKERRAVRTKWAIKEETLHSFERTIAEFNHDQAEKIQQELVEEAVLRKWLIDGPESGPES